MQHARGVQWKQVNLHDMHLQYIVLQHVVCPIISTRFRTL